MSLRAYRLANCCTVNSQKRKVRRFFKNKYIVLNSKLPSYYGGFLITNIIFRTGGRVSLRFSASWFVRTRGKISVEPICFRPKSGFGRNYIFTNVISERRDTCRLRNVITIFYVFTYLEIFKLPPQKKKNIENTPIHLLRFGSAELPNSCSINGRRFSRDVVVFKGQQKLTRKKR